MSQRSRNIRKCFSQPSTSTAINNNDDEEYRACTQVPFNETLTNQEHAHHVGNAVKYILAADHSKIPIMRSAISKAIGCQGKNFRAVMISAQEALKDVFGYKLIDVENGKYILCNMIKNDLPHLRFNENIENHYVLLFLTLTHIYMSGEICTEGSLIDFLIKLGIISENSIMSDTFGNVLELITVTFVKEKYIILEKTENNEKYEAELKWGVRAYEELSLRSVMEFVSKIYGNIDMKTWPQQYEGMLQRESLNEEQSANIDRNNFA